MVPTAPILKLPILSSDSSLSVMTQSVLQSTTTGSPEDDSPLSDWVEIRRPEPQGNDTAPYPLIEEDVSPPATRERAVPNALLFNITSIIIALWVWVFQVPNISAAIVGAFSSQPALRRGISRFQRYIGRSHDLRVKPCNRDLTPYHTLWTFLHPLYDDDDVNFLHLPNCRAANREAHYASALLPVLQLESIKYRLLSLRGQEAERFLDILQEVLDSSGQCCENHPETFDKQIRDFRHISHRLLIRCVKASKKVPPCLFISDVQSGDMVIVGGGGQSDICEGTYRGARVALKHLRIFQSTPSAVDFSLDFYREALIMRHLRHPNVLTVLGVAKVVWSNSPCLVMPFMEHGHARDFVQAGCLDPLQLLFEVAQGLAYIHGENVVHGDLRGANVLIDKNGHARIADCGLAHFIVATSGKSQSDITGSPRWMAPELLDPVRFGTSSTQYRPTEASDVYAFACLCWELYTLRNPFDDVPPGNESAVTYRIIRGERPPRPTTTRYRLDVPGKVWSLIEKCWKSSSSARPPIAGVLDVLRLAIESRLA